MPLTNSAVAAATFKAGYFTALGLMIPPVIDYPGTVEPAVSLPRLFPAHLALAEDELVVPNNARLASTYRAITSARKASLDSSAQWGTGPLAMAESASVLRHALERGARRRMAWRAD